MAQQVQSPALGTWPGTAGQLKGKEERGLLFHILASVVGERTLLSTRSLQDKAQRFRCVYSGLDHLMQEGEEPPGSSGVDSSFFTVCSFQRGAAAVGWESSVVGPPSGTPVRIFEAGLADPAGKETFTPPGNMDQWPPLPLFEQMNASTISMLKEQQMKTSEGPASSPH
ncbi:hypothetical protein Q8A67_000946 [Cirrhinus molitorella]|uniref:Uncharacterized protein n=1 Tax=Cirrhinus molitorella TaxID=172907 RepID=A0AA88Q8E0_9TELE|nr:hypothetical protein Q8A67_000946 [Cirrhinus molitorella]